MHVLSSMSQRPRLRVAAIALSFAACGHEAVVCTQQPCALPVAIEVTVVDSATGAPVAGVSLALAGAVSGQAPCATGTKTVCEVRGGAGSYELALSAPGYRTATQQVVVQGTTASCGCGSVKTERVTLALAAS